MTPDRVVHTGFVGGLRLASDVPLPAGVPKVPDGDIPDVRIIVTAIPRLVETVVKSGPVLHVTSDGTCRYAISGVATFLIRGGVEILIDAEPGAARHDIWTFLFGPVFAILSYQRGLLPVHASCFEIDGRAVLVAGAGAAGKSTLAAAALRAGHRVLSDDITVLSVAPGSVRAWPTVPVIALWPDVVGPVGADQTAFVPRRTGTSRMNLSLGDNFCQTPIDVDAVVYLTQTNDLRACGLRMLTTHEAVPMLHDHVHTATYSTLMRDGGSTLQRVASATAVIRHQAMLVWCPSRTSLTERLESIRRLVAQRAV